MKEHLNKLEERMAQVFKGAPVIPENGRKSIVNVMPWVALIFGVLQLLATLSLWNAGQRVNDVINAANQIAANLEAGSIAPELNVFYWLAVVFAAVSGILLLLAYPGLKARTKDGWNWLFYGGLVNVVYGVASLFFDTYYGGGFGRLLSAFIASAITFWVLFQIRDHYRAKKTTAVK